jgi:hypothetical protein
VQFEQTSGAKNRVPVSGGVVYSGYAYVNDISVTAGNRQNTTYSIQLQGDGELSKNS